MKTLNQKIKKILANPLTNDMGLYGDYKALRKRVSEIVNTEKDFAKEIKWMGNTSQMSTEKLQRIVDMYVIRQELIKDPDREVTCTSELVARQNLIKSNLYPDPIGEIKLSEPTLDKRRFEDLPEEENEQYGKKYSNQALCDICLHISQQISPLHGFVIKHDKDCRAILENIQFHLSQLQSVNIPNKSQEWIEGKTKFLLDTRKRKMEEFLIKENYIPHTFSSGFAQGFDCLFNMLPEGAKIQLLETV